MSFNMRINENKSNNVSNSLKLLVMSALFAAIITFTTWLFHIPIGTNGGYIHFGDAFIFIAASMLPTPYACAAAAIGGGLADLLSGAAVWMPATIIIKASIAALFTAKKDNFITKRNIIALPLALILTCGGYYIAEGIIFGNFVAPLASVSGNLIQGGGSIAIYLVLALSFDKLKFKGKR